MTTKTKSQPITIYGAEWCAYCHVAMEYLDSKKVSYKYVDIDKDPTAGMYVVEKTEQRGIPVIEIGDKFIIGYDRPKIDEALGLD